MALSPGDSIGPYEIVGLLGEGGMGEVYRALDPRIDRQVAIKVLPSSVAEDPSRLRRFEQEAKSAGSLNHPNLLTIFELGTHETSPYIVSELLEGQTLRDLLQDPAAAAADGPFPLRKIVDYGSQIATGLSAAHEKGIVHRDLKPDNIFVTNDGRVKILDFGLAKLVTTSDDGLTNAETAEHHTDPGTVLGTMGYMSPEQVRGLNVDARSDIFSLGAILFEMVTGERAFKGQTSADTMSAILTRDPLESAEASAITSPALKRIVDHCLEKRPEQRFQSAHDLAFDLSTISSFSDSGVGYQAVEPAHTATQSRVPLLVALLIGVVLGAMAVFFGRSEVPEPRAPHFIRLTHSGQDAAPAASPDGKTIAFASLRDRSSLQDRFSVQGTGRIWLKQLSGGGEVAITSGPLDSSPRFSPDGSSLLFLRGGRNKDLMRIPILGGAERTIRSEVSGADWSPDGNRIVFTQIDNDESQVTSSIGTISISGTEEKTLATVSNSLVRLIRWSPDGSRIVAVKEPTTGTTASRIVFIDPEDGTVTPFDDPLAAGFQVFPSWAPSGKLIWSQTDSTLSLGARILIHDFDRKETRTLFWTLEGVGVIDVVSPDRILFATTDQRQNLLISPTYEESGTNDRWLTRGTGVDRQPSYSPDGEWVIFSSNRTGNLDLWEISSESGALTRLTDDSANDWDPAYTPDGESILWSSDRSGNYEIWMARRDGSGARQVSRDGVDAENPTMSADGEWIVYSSAGSDNRGIWKVRPDGSDATRIVEGNLILPEISPDGKWVSFVVAGQATASSLQIRVVRLADGEPVFEIVVRSSIPTTNLGRHRWLPDGSKIVFWSSDEEGNFGFFAQDFVPGRDTSASVRKFAGFDSEVQAESIGISPDGSEATISVMEFEFAVALADGVDGIARD